MAGVDFTLVLSVVFFMFSMWIVGRTFKYFRQPAILGYLLTGIMYGPNFLDIVPYASDGSCVTMVVNNTMQRLESSDAYGGGHRRMLAAASSSANGTSSYGHSCSTFPWERWEPGNHIINIWTFVGNVRRE